MSFGFIITRHVNSEKTNKYWNQNVKLIRSHYPFKQIIIIDDNSNEDFIKSDFEYQNVTIIQSEYHGRGELLPFIYFLRYKWFENAIIIHDSVFIHERIPFEKFNIPVLPLWHYRYDKENLENLLRIANSLTQNMVLKKNLTNNDIPLGLNITNNNFKLCFGSQCYINLQFLEKLESKYTITNLVNVITCRSDRCGLERIMGMLFCMEYPDIKKINSLLGNIHKHYNAFLYYYDEYYFDFQNKRIPHKIVKVWTGR